MEHKWGYMNFTQLMSGVECEFGDETGVARLFISDDWLQGRTVFGGLQAALAVRAMRQLVAPALLLRSMQVTFVGPVVSGPVSVQAKVLRRGKSAVHVRAEVVVEEQLCLTVLAIFGGLRDTAFSERPVAPLCAKLPEQLVSMPFIPNVTPAFTRHVEMRWAKGQPPFCGEKDANAQIYVRHRDDPVMSEAHLVAACDIIPPPILSKLSKPTPASSMSWQLEILADPAHLNGQSWLRFDSEMMAAHSGYSWQTAKIWSSQGDLVAIAHQCVAVFG